MDKSYSAMTRSELSKLRFGTNGQVLAELAALSFAVGNIKLGRGSFSLEIISENEEVILRASSMIKKLYGDFPEIIKVEKNQPKRHTAYIIEIVPQSREGKLLFDIGLLEGAGDNYSFGNLNESIFEPQGCLEAAARGAFLGYGILCDPEKSYRMEFVLSHDGFAELLMQKLCERGFEVKMLERNERNVLYLKQIESISEMLIFIGAQNVMLDVENVHVLKDVKNKLNRGNNCFIANTGKTVTAAQRQLEDIEILLKNDVKLSDTLLEACELRCEHPEASLQELAEISGTTTKSALNKRFIKLHDLREEFDK